MEVGNLLPRQALEEVDFLNEYPHFLPAPGKNLLGIDIAFERPNVLASGDKVQLQVGISSRKPQPVATQLHLLVYNPEDLSQTMQSRLEQSTQAMISQQALMPQGSSITMDTLNPVAGLNQIKRLKPQADNELDLVQFLRRYARDTDSSGKHHFVLLLAGEAARWHKRQQDLVDLAKLFAVNEARLSVVAVGDDLQVAFLKALAKHGQGRLKILTERSDIAAWFSEELHFVNAAKLSDIRLQVSSQHGALINGITSPQGVTSSDHFIDYTIPQLIQGQTYVMLVELQTPVISSTDQPKDLISVTLDYIDPVTKRYYSVNKSGKLNYVLDPNQANLTNDNVTRSLLILKTRSVLLDTVPVIQNKRYYKAVAMLSSHAQQLQAMGHSLQDASLIRDAEILNRYADQLYEYDEKPFQTVSIWHDLYWDTARYKGQFD